MIVVGDDPSTLSGLARRCPGARTQNRFPLLPIALLEEAPETGQDISGP